MLARIRTSAKEKDQGFTLIELLVVMVIIGILAAIAIPVFLSQSQKAAYTATKADVSSLGKEVATYYIDNTAAPAAGVVINAAGQYTFNGAGNIVGRRSQATITVNNQGYTSSTAWCVSLTNTNGSGAPIWKYSAQNGLQNGACVNGTDY